MFSFFKKKSQPVTVNDFVWISDKAKEDGLIMNIRTRRKEGGKIGLFYYFDSTKEWLVQILQASDFGVSDRAGIELYSASDLMRSSYADSGLKRLLNTSNYLLIFAEHYPIRSKDELVFEKLHQLSGKKENLEFHLSLKEPLMAVFGSERIMQTMQQMGHKEAEPINHSMVTKAIARAQEKIEKKVQNELRAKSAKEWFSLNYPE